MIQMTLHDMSERRKKVAEFCRQCKLQFPEEVAELFKALHRVDLAVQVHRRHL